MQALNIFHVLIAVSMVAFILIQKGPGATAGAAFGSGASGTVFGARGAGNFLTKSSWVLAVLFCSISLTMAVMVSRGAAQPENDLGVVASSQTQGQTQDQSQVVPVSESDVGVSDASGTEVSVGADDSVESDVPLMDEVSDIVDSYEIQTSSAVNNIPRDSGDLPVLDTEAIEIAVKDESVADGSDG